MVATFGPTDAPERVADICAGNVTSARTNVRSGGNIVLEFVGVVKDFARGAGQTHLNSDAKIADEGRPQGAPLPIVFSRRFALRRAPTRGAPTDCLLSAFGPGKGTHKGCPYRLSSLCVMPWGGRPQGAPLPIVFSRRLALGRAPTRGAPDCLLSAFCPGKGTHKGCPYRLSSLGVWPWEGHPQGAPLPIVFSRRLALGRAPTRGAPTDCLLSAFGPGKGTHKGRPYPIQAALRGFVPI